MKDKDKPVGRPSKYKREYAQKARDYALSPEGEKFPTLAGLACHLGVCRDTIHEWTKAVDDKTRGLKHPEFSDAIKAMKAIQERDLVNGALNGDYQPTFAIFFAKNNLGMKDSVTQEHTGVKDGPTIKMEMAASDKLKEMIGTIAKRSGTDSES